MLYLSIYCSKSIAIFLILFVIIVLDTTWQNLLIKKIKSKQENKIDKYFIITGKIEVLYELYGILKSIKCWQGGGDEYTQIV